MFIQINYQAAFQSNASPRGSAENCNLRDQDDTLQRQIRKTPGRAKIQAEGRNSENLSVRGKGRKFKGLGKRGWQETEKRDPASRRDTRGSMLSIRDWQRSNLIRRERCIFWEIFAVFRSAFRPT